MSPTCAVKPSICVFERECAREMQSFSQQNYRWAHKAFTLSKRRTSHLQSCLRRQLSAASPQPGNQLVSVARRSLLTSSSSWNWCFVLPHRPSDVLGSRCAGFRAAMPPVNDETEQVKKIIADEASPVVVFSKTTCPFCTKVKKLFDELGIKANIIELDTIPNGGTIQNILINLTGQKTVPNVFIRGQHIGGCDNTMKLHSEGKLLPLVNGGSDDNANSINIHEQPSKSSTSHDGGKANGASVGPGVNGVPMPVGTLTTSAPSESAAKKYKSDHGYDYDLVVIGGGSGGLAASKAAAKLGAKVAVFDFVQPTPIGTTWGLGGTCVNVGCIPKKLMHQASLLGESLGDAVKFGWELADGKPKHNWTKMVDEVQNYIHSLNWKYKVALRDANVTYINAYAKFADPHTVIGLNAKKKETKVTADKFLIATGGRPRYPDVPGAKEYAITSDDIFSLPYPPGKTLCVGASYVALECAGFLAGMGYDTTVRSILLRGFDQDMANRIGEFMEKEKGVKFVRRYLPTKIELIEAGTPGRLRVTSEGEGEPIVEEYNTVLFAIGRDPGTGTIGLENTGVKVNSKSGKIPARNEQTNVDHLYAIGDVLDGRPELTPVAIQAGTLLAERLFGGSNVTYDYEMVPTTVFTPLEYGAIGLPEEDAVAKYGAENIEVYHTNYRPLEWTVPGHGENHCYGKLVCNKLEKERVVGFHVLGPNAGEITQGYAVGMRLGATKKDFDMTTGIHPTASEIFTTLTVSKSKGGDPGQAGC